MMDPNNNNAQILAPDNNNNDNPNADADQVFQDAVQEGIDLFAMPPPIEAEIVYM